MPQNNYDRRFYGNNGGNYGTTPKEATAPYNFVPLPLEPVPSPLSLFLTEKDSGTGKVRLNFSKYADYIAENGKYDGVIDFEITALTPLFIGDGNGNFFAPGGVPTIPGSTIRGMVKNYLKILSCGTMRSANNEDITSRHLYFRDMASTCRSLKSHYEDKLVIKGSKKRSSKTKASAGFFARLKNGEYVIYPAELDYGHYMGRSDMESKSGSKENPGRIHCSSDNKVELHSGPMPNKKTYYIFSISSWDNPIKVPESVITDYKNDITRKGHNLLSQDQSIHDKYKPASGKGFSLLKPCFYIAETKNNEKEVIHFGAAKFYRIAYDNDIGKSIIPAVLNNNLIIDFAEAIFGRKEDFASRIFFEDASIQQGNLLKKHLPHNLMSPNPTSFQLYLEQESQDNLSHWDSFGAKIRGYKLYWHRNTDNGSWKFTDGKDQKVDKMQEMQPAPIGSKFKGRIRFKNLSKEELGAILAVLNLGSSENGNKGRFKIGMGKPLGMGSIEFKCNSFQLINRKTRYSSLFADCDWKSGFYSEEIKSFTDVFENYVKEYINKKIGNTYKYDEVKETLAIMMDWFAKPNNSKTAYMPLDEDIYDRFKKRAVLPKPGKIVNRIPKSTPVKKQMLSKLPPPPFLVRRRDDHSAKK